MCPTRSRRPAPRLFFPMRPAIRRGHCCIITDAQTIDIVIAAMKPACGDVTIFPLFGTRHTAERVLISGRVGVRGGATEHIPVAGCAFAIAVGGIQIHMLTMMPRLPVRFFRKI